MKHVLDVGSFLKVFEHEDGTHLAISKTEEEKDEEDEYQIEVKAEIDGVIASVAIGYKDEEKRDEFFENKVDAAYAKKFYGALDTFFSEMKGVAGDGEDDVQKEEG